MHNWQYEWRRRNVSRIDDSSARRKRKTNGRSKNLEAARNALAKKKLALEIAVEHIDKENYWREQYAEKLEEVKSLEAKLLLL